VTHWRTLMDSDSRYVAAYELGGKDVTLKIKSASSATVDGPKGAKRKAIITFEGARKPFLANPTNCKTIELMYGSDYEGWTGKAITLFPTKTASPDGVVDCIRVRPVAGGTAATE
jgi:hypothetical protein